MRALAIAFVWLLAAAAAPAAELAPRIEHIASEDGAEIEAHVFDPGPRQTPRAAMVLLHGGGWVAGDATWVHSRARLFAARGMVTVALDYRLGNPGQATADTRAAIRWLRANATRLNVDPNRIAGYGVSAGGQLILSAAQSDDATARPSAVVLVSPAVDLESDGWFSRLAGAEAARQLSPLANVRAGLPPTLILQGDVDTVTPLPGAQRFCEAMSASGGECVLQVYNGFGHLFTPAGVSDSDTPRPDAATSAASAVVAEDFLRARGFID